MPHTSLSAISVAATQRPAAPPPAGLERWAPCTSLTRTARCGHCLCACSSCKVVKAAQGKHSLANLGVVCFCSASAPSPTAARALFVGTPTARKTRSAWRLQVSCHVPSLPGKWLCLHKARKAARCVQECSVAYGQSEAPEATWADAAVSEGVRAGPSLCYSWYTCASSGASQGRSLAQVCDAAAWLLLFRRSNPTAVCGPGEAGAVVPGPHRARGAAPARAAGTGGRGPRGPRRPVRCNATLYLGRVAPRVRRRHQQPPRTRQGSLAWTHPRWLSRAQACHAHVRRTPASAAHPSAAHWRRATSTGNSWLRRALRMHAGYRRRWRTRRRRAGAAPSR